MLSSIVPSSAPSSSSSYPLSSSTLSESSSKSGTGSVVYKDNDDHPLANVFPTHKVCPLNAFDPSWDTKVGSVLYGRKNLDWNKIDKAISQAENLKESDKKKSSASFSSSSSSSLTDNKSTTYAFESEKPSSIVLVGIRKVLGIEGGEAKKPLSSKKNSAVSEATSCVWTATADVAAELGDVSELYNSGSSTASSSTKNDSAFDSKLLGSSAYSSSSIADRTKINTNRSEYKSPSKHDSSVITAYISGSKVDSNSNLIYLNCL